MVREPDRPEAFIKELSNQLHTEFTEKR